MPKTYHLNLMAETTVHSTVEAEGRRVGLSRRKGWFQRIKVGTFPQRGRPGRFAVVEMVMKRVGFGDWYREKVIDAETGQVLRDCDEPLSQHQRRGSAKPQA